jgi:hypothetical protein
MQMLEIGKNDSIVHKRPILDNLFSMKYKMEPKKFKNADYNKFMQEIKKFATIEDEFELPFD